MAFKKAQVQSGQISGTSHNDFPIYVDLSRVGITTLAEAQSSRWYIDEDQIVEIAREAVSELEGHGKIPSLTSTTELFIDYDGIRADYAVGDTYGRNAVWGDYGAVWHMNNDPSGTAPQMIDSTGNGIDGTTIGSMTTADLISAQIANGLDFDGSNDKVDFGDVDTDIVTNDAYTFSTWFKADTTEGVGRLFDMEVNNQKGIALYINTGTLTYRQWDGSAYIDRSYAFTDTASFHKADIVWNGSTVFDYLDSTLKTAGGTSVTGYVNAIDFFIGGRVSTANQYLNGQQDEVRVRASALSANWITTEYNNQNDNAAFWGTWTDAGGGPTPTPSARRLLLMGM